MGLFELRGYLPQADESEKLEPIEIEELDRLLSEGKVEVLDVREKSERDEGYIDGTRHLPYRLVAGLRRRPAKRAAGDHDLLERHPRHDRGKRLAANGIEAHPVVGGGVEDWAERGGKTVQFRRCGS